MPQLEDTGVSARPLGEARGDVVEKLTENVPVRDLATGQTPGVKVAPLAQRYELLGEGTKFLGLSRGRLDPLVLKERRSHIAQRRLLVTGSPREGPALLSMPHLSALSLAGLGRLDRILVHQEELAVLALPQANAEVEAVLIQEVRDLL